MCYKLADTYASIEIANADTTVSLCVVRAAFASVSARGRRRDSFIFRSISQSNAVFALRNSSVADGEKVKAILDEKSGILIVYQLPHRETFSTTFIGSRNSSRGRASRILRCQKFWRCWALAKYLRSKYIAPSELGIKF